MYLYKASLFGHLCLNAPKGHQDKFYGGGGGRVTEHMCAQKMTRAGHGISSLCNGFILGGNVSGVIVSYIDQMSGRVGL